MKTVKAFSFLLTLLMLISAFVACGNTPAETTGKPGGSSVDKPDDDQQEIEDTVPTDLNYKGETVTFLSATIVIPINMSWLVKSLSTIRCLMPFIIVILT